MEKIRILIVDDHPIMRDGICALLSLQKDIEIVGEATDGKESIQKALEFVPDVILMDLAMPGMDGLEATRLLKKKIPQVKILVLTQHETKGYILSAIKAGAAGYIPKKALSSELLQAIHTVNRGDSYLNSSATKAVMEDYQQQVKKDPYDKLTAREREIMKLVAEGHISREIAKMLSITVNTVLRHRDHVNRKLNLHSRTDLIKYAIQQGLLNIAI